MAMEQENKDILQKFGLLGLGMVFMTQGTMLLYNQETAWIGLVLCGLSLVSVFLREALKFKK